MKQRFKYVTSGQLYSTPLEAHLVKVAKTWRKGQGSIKLETVDHFYNALQREKDLYCQDHHSARVSSVRIVKTEMGVCIGPADKSQPLTITVNLLNAAEIDQQQVQDSLLIPLR